MIVEENNETIYENELDFIRSHESTAPEHKTINANQLVILEAKAKIAEIV